MEPQHEERPHLPAPTLYPVGFAAGIAVALVGLIVSPKLISPIGGAIAVLFAFLWIRDATTEYRGVPEEVEPERREVRPTETAAARPADEGDAAMAAPEPGERFARSRFLEGATLGLGGVIGGLVSIPALGFAVIPAFTKQGEKEVDLGPLGNFPEGEWKLATFFLDPDAGEVSRRTAYVRNNGVVDGGPNFTLISNRCAHLGCPVQPNGPVFDESKKEIEVRGNQRITLIKMLPAGGFGCPCHGGQYDPQGNRTAGPPVRALDRYEYSIKNGNLYLGRTYSVSHVDLKNPDDPKTALIHKYRLAGPGQHVKGVEGWLYPLQPPH